ncbi:DUF1552 domain-containing protein [Blastopirellula marina]|uniref:DUF1552 domain-containing protein n=1 Tax=Blastopirellula marina TaxID=124 RepID=A0A2S8GMS5_9BACT|nr:DUF1552 domain-containing protein [Blastopirellula marina]PQO45727.1 hypothetical protein C5Y93_12415 [Blastopirellula marina]
MISRRNFLHASLLGAGAMAFSRPERLFAAPGKPPMRFIFLHRGNGLFPKVMAPPSFDEKLAAKENRKEAFEVDLDGHDLPQWMSPLADHVDNLTILQGLSGKMCTTGHHSWCSSLGVYKANERISSIKWATVDFELAKLFPSPVEHIELACFPLDGGNARGSLDGIAQGFSARGPQQPNYAYGSPRVALSELFKTVAEDKAAQAEYQLDRMLLEFVAGNETAQARGLTGGEKSKITNYSDSIEMIRTRNAKIDAMADVIRQHVPELDPKYLDPDVNTLDRQVGHVEVLLGALISGLTNVVAFTVDELGHHYTGIPGIEGEKVNMHDVGHGKTIGGLEAEEIRNRCRHHHMTLVERIVTRLKSVPEAGGTMFDNTMIFYFPDSGETHHSHGTEFPFVVMAGDNCPLDLGRRYIRLPGYGQEGHKTLGNWYTTLLNAYGNPIDHFGALDVGLKNINQRGPIERFLG